jgi:DNA-binding MarR family transcriptional regulator
VHRDKLAERDFVSLHRFRSEIRRFLHFSEEAARSLGVEPQQHQLLLAVKSAPEGHLRITEIASALYIKHHSAVELVDRTLKQGLVRRERSERDRREVNVLITPEGEKILRQLSMHHRAELRRMGPELVAALENIVDHIDAPTPALSVAGR